jgi:hypothetical protein
MFTYIDDENEKRPTIQEVIIDLEKLMKENDPKTYEEIPISLTKHKTTIKY